MQSQPSGDTEVFLDQSHFSKDIEITQEKPQQLEGIGKQDVVTQEPTSSRVLVEDAFQLEANEPEVYIIPNQNLEDIDVTP